MSVRHSAVAGMFYPKEVDKLREFANYAVQSAPNMQKKPIILISPHAGFMYSGYTAGYAFGQLKNLDQNKEYKILIIGPSHKVYLDSASISPDDLFETPLGDVKVDMDESLRLKQKFPNNITINEVPHKLEHSLEVQLPFLQASLKNFTIVPIVYGNIGDIELFEILEDFLLDDSRIAIVSSDLSHYYPQKEAVMLDSYCIKGVEELDLQAMQSCEACGKPAILAAIRYALKHNLKSKTLDYKTSGDTTGDRDSVVGYGSFMFYKEGQ
jgi:MEMO1 family protein